METEITLSDIIKKYKDKFPNLSSENAQKTSDNTEMYNCIAWAYGKDNCCMWPDKLKISLGIAYWPEDIPCEESINAFVELFSGIGYKKCCNKRIERNYEKIAIYTKNKIPTHAAKQLPNGKKKN
jgi:hypothetical protein